MEQTKAISEARNLVEILLTNALDWPEDAWLSMGKNFDINLYLEGDTPRCVLYPVVDASANVPDGFVIL